MNTTTDTIAEAARAAAEEIRGCQQAPAGSAKQAFAKALDRVVHVRNERIRSLGAGGAGSDGELQRLNAILSLMAGIEFPLGGFHRERLGQVEQALAALHGGG